MSHLKESMQWHYLLFLTYFLLRFYFYYSASWLGLFMSYALRVWHYLVFIPSFPRIRLYFSTPFPGLGTLRPTFVIFFIPYLFSFLVWVHFVLLRFGSTCLVVFESLLLSGFLSSTNFWLLLSSALVFRLSCASSI